MNGPRDERPPKGSSQIWSQATQHSPRESRTLARRRQPNSGPQSAPTHLRADKIGVRFTVGRAVPLGSNQLMPLGPNQLSAAEYERRGRPAPIGAVPGRARSIPTNCAAPRPLRSQAAGEAPTAANRRLFMVTERRTYPKPPPRRHSRNPSPSHQSDRQPSPPLYATGCPSVVKQMRVNMIHHHRAQYLAD